MERLAIIGSSDLAQFAIHHVSQSNKFEILGIYDDFLSIGSLVNNVKCIGKIENIIDDFESGKFDKLFICVGYSRMDYRASVFMQFKNLIPFANIIHHSCIIDSTVELGEGIFLFPGVILDKGVKVKDNVLLNIGVTIAHDSTIYEHCFFAPRATVAGFTEIASKCFVGTNATIIDNIKICSDVILGAGSVTVKSINNVGIYIGVPSVKLLK